MPRPFSEKLRLVLKLMSMSSGQLASELETDKSVISRWVSGSVTPSAHNMTRLTALVAKRVNGFRMLDWEREPRGLALLLGGDPSLLGEETFGAAPSGGGLPIAIWDQLIATAALRAAAYEGLYRITRPHPADPGRFLVEHGLVRRDANGLPRLRIGSGGTVVDGWMLPLHNQLYVIAADTTSGTMLFGIFNGVGSAKVGVIDGIALFPLVRTPTATAIVCERIADLSGSAEADERRFAELVALSPLAPDGAVPEALQRHLVRDLGPAQLALGGDWLLKAPMERSLARAAEDKPAS